MIDLTPLKDEYVRMVLEDHRQGKTDVMANYKAVYGNSHDQAEDESDIEWLTRCAEQDFFDGQHDAAIYQDFYDELIGDLEDMAEFVQRIVKMYESGEDNAYEVYLRDYKEKPGEDDLAFVKRCAMKDYAKGKNKVAVYQDVYDEVHRAEPEYTRFIQCDESLLGMLASLGAEFKEYDHTRGGVYAEVNHTAMLRIAEFAADFKIAELPGDGMPAREAGLGPTGISPYGAVRIATMYCGLIPVHQFDAVEIEEMTQDSITPTELVPADQEGDVVAAISVRLHYRRGGVETVGDFWFDAPGIGGRNAAEQKARELALSLGDMIMMADPALEPEYVLGKHLAATQVKKAPVVPGVEFACLS